MCIDIDYIRKIASNHEGEDVEFKETTGQLNRFVAEESAEQDNTSLPPNPDIADVMFIGGLIEHWGRGLSMMSKECVKAGLPRPERKDNGFVVKVVFARPNDKYKKAVEEQPENSNRTDEEQLENISAP